MMKADRLGLGRPWEDRPGVFLLYLEEDMTISDDDIEELAKSPSRTRTDEGEVQERSVDDLIKADRHLNQRNATKVPWGMRIARTKPGGTVN